MKRKFLVPAIVLVACLVVFFGYRIFDRHITDTVAPRITITESDEVLQVSVNDAEEVLLQGVTAEDARDGDVTDSIIIESIANINQEHEVTVTYAAFDKAGNVAKAQRTVQYTDYVGPRFTLSAPMVFVFTSRFDAMDCIGAWDALDGDISHRVKATMMDESTISAEGVHHVQFRVTNSLGDTAQIVIPVEVHAAGRYGATLKLKETIVYLPAGSDFSPEDYLDTLQLSNTSIDLSDDIPDTVTMETEGQVDTNTPGTYAVSYTVSTNRGGFVYAGFSKLIVVVEG